MQILVDADANPAAVTEILYRAANRKKITLTLVANQKLKIPDSLFIKNHVVKEGPDEADDKIVEMVKEGDLVITTDIPLADRVIKKGATVINPRGKLYTRENIKEKLSMRNLMTELRSGGIQTERPSVFSIKDKQAFANQLDRFLTKHLN